MTCGWPSLARLGSPAPAESYITRLLDIFLKLQQYDIMHNELMGFILEGTQMTRAVQKLGSVKLIC